MSSNPRESDARPIESVDALIDDFARRCKPREAFRVGAEFEFFGIELPQGRPLGYEGPHGIRALFETFVERGWRADREDRRPIALSRGQAALTLEPGGQVELAGSPGEDLEQVAAELHSVAAELVEAGRSIGVRFYQCGRQPFFTLDEIPWVPKGRYAVMRPYLGARGRLAHRMMKETSSIQVSLDFSSEEDLDRKFRLVSRLAPVTTALFANSAVARGVPSGQVCERASIWRETDPDRCGLIPAAFDERFGFCGHVGFALDMPMMFLYRDGFVPMNGLPFREFLARGHDGQPATWDDWNLHLSGTFTDVRLKSYLEIRTADALPWPLCMSVPALWVGLLYDERALAGAEALVEGWSWEETEALVPQVALHGLKASARGRPLLALAEQLVALAHDGLPAGQRPFLIPLADQLASDGACPAVRFIERWETRWHADRDAFLAENGLERMIS